MVRSLHSLPPLGVLLAHHPVQQAQLGHGAADHHHGVGGQAVVKVVQAVQEYQSFSYLTGRRGSFTFITTAAYKMDGEYLIYYFNKGKGFL